MPEHTDDVAGEYDPGVHDAGGVVVTGVAGVAGGVQFLVPGIVLVSPGHLVCVTVPVEHSVLGSAPVQVGFAGAAVTEHIPVQLFVPVLTCPQIFLAERQATPLLAAQQAETA